MLWDSSRTIRRQASVGVGVGVEGGGRERRIRRIRNVCRRGREGRRDMRGGAWWDMVGYNGVMDVLCV